MQIVMRLARCSMPDATIARGVTDYRFGSESIQRDST